MRILLFLILVYFLVVNCSKRFLIQEKRNTCIFYLERQVTDKKERLINIHSILYDETMKRNGQRIYVAVDKSIEHVNDTLLVIDIKSKKVNNFKRVEEILLSNTNYIFNLSCKNSDSCKEFTIEEKSRIDFFEKRYKKNKIIIGSILIEKYR